MIPVRSDSILSFRIVEKGYHNVDCGLIMGVLQWTLTSVVSSYSEFEYIHTDFTI